MDNRRLLIAALLSLGVLLLWQMLFPPPSPPPPVRVEEPAAGGLEEATGAAGQEAAAPEPGSPPVVEAEGELPLIEAETAARSRREVVLETESVVVRISNQGGQILSFRLKDKPDADGNPLELVRRREAPPYPLAFVNASGEPLPINGALFEVAAERSGARRGVELRYRGPLGEARKRIFFGEETLFQVEVEVRGLEPGWGLLLGPDIRNAPAKVLSSRSYHRSFSYLVGDELEALMPQKLEEPQSVPGRGVSWFGLEDSYFLTALVPETPVDQVAVRPVVLETPGEEGDDETPGLLAVVQPAGSLFQAKAYWGPKEYNILAASPYGFEKTVRWGMFGLLSRPLLYGLRWTYDNVVHNYGWAIVLMTILIKIVLFPLTHKSYVSMQKLQKLNPRMESIRQKYRPKLKDKQGKPNLEMQRKMNEEMQQLFREEGVNPAGGCLPILLQIPVFIAFFNLLRSAVELWNAPWMLWIVDLSVPDPYYVIPLVMGASQVLQQRMTPTPPNPSQQMIMRTMPIVFTIFSLGFPSGLVLYWLTNNLLTIVQQGGYNRLKKAGYFGGEAESPDRKAAPAKGRGRSRKALAAKGK